MMGVTFGKVGMLFGSLSSIVDVNFIKLNKRAWSCCYHIVIHLNNRYYLDIQYHAQYFSGFSDQSEL